MTPSRPRHGQNRAFLPGERVQITGPKGKRNTITLEPGRVFHTHRGALEHDAIIGIEEGSLVVSTTGVEYLALRPLLADFVMSMTRGAAIVYPKDAAHILAQADIYPGARVVEAGVGSGALSLWLLRAIGKTGHLVSIERRTEFADIARANVASFMGRQPENWAVEIGDLSDVLPRVERPHSVDRIVLDMLAPWEGLEECGTALAPGGVLLCYVATVTQLSRVTEAVRASGDYTEPCSSETLVRDWHVDGLAVRPEHRMVGHTGFIMTARRLAPGTTLPRPKRRVSKSAFNDEDIEKWTPGALGERVISDRRLRRKVRTSAAQAPTATASPTQ